jgi:hypothetical protein
MPAHYANGVIISPDNRVLLTSKNNGTLDLEDNSSLSIETYVPAINDKKKEIEDEIKMVLGDNVVNCLAYLDSFTTPLFVNNFLNRNLSVHIYKLKKKCTFKIFDPLQNQLLFMTLTEVYERTVNETLNLNSNGLKTLQYLMKNRKKFGEPL